MRLTVDMSARNTFTAQIPQIVKETSEFLFWLEWLTGLDLERVESARSKIESEGLMTNVKSLGSGLYEKKWTSGLRVYFAVIEDGSGRKILLLLGSSKGKKQHQAILSCKRMLENFVVFRGSIRKKD